MDREYYEQLKKKAVEVFGYYETDQEEEEDHEEDVEDEKKDSSVGDDHDDPELQYGAVVDVCGTKICLSSDDEQTL